MSNLLQSIFVCEPRTNYFTTLIPLESGWYAFLWEFYLNILRNNNVNNYQLFFYISDSVWVRQMSSLSPDSIVKYVI